MRTAFPAAASTTLLALLFTACFVGELLAGGPVPMSTRRIALGLQRPLLAVAPDGDYEHLFIVEQRGRIRVYDMVSATLLPTPFLDIDSLIGGGTSGGDERGLLGLAFHPNYLTNGEFFVYYTNNSGTTTVSRYEVSTTNPNIADSSTAQILLTVSQPYSNHNGGMIAFGPNDGYLYIGLGDGVSANDPGNRAQNTGQLLGKLLRIDVDSGFPYGIPATNPFVGPGNPLDEIWAIGLRNPWRFSFDRETGDLWIGDVGQYAREEIDFVSATSTGGENYGWRCTEGNGCTGLSGCTCNGSTLTPPIYTFLHSSGNCSVTGGYCYKGCAMPAMHGTYFFGDYCSNQIWSFQYNGSSITNFQTRTNELNPPGTPAISSISGFGEDAFGEVYVCDLFGGEVFKIVPADIESLDCNGNFIVDECEAAVGLAVDCDNNGVSDACDILDGNGTDCDGNGVLDSCEFAGNDCNQNGVFDACDIEDGTENDCDDDGVPDSCQVGPENDCDDNGIIDVCEIAAGSGIDCDMDGGLDVCQLANGTAEDCNGNILLDICEIDAGIATDCDGNLRIDNCEIDDGTGIDCDGNQILDSCDIASGTHQDSDGNGIPDVCEEASFSRGDCNADGSLDVADPIRALDYLFGGGSTPVNCYDSLDVNDDGALDISDPVYLLGVLFGGTLVPPAPYPGCGTDPTADTLTCISFAGCL